MNKLVKLGSKVCAISLVAVTLVGCGKIPTLKDGQEAVVTLNEGSISTEDLYKKIKNTYGKTVLIDMIDKTVLDAKYKTVTDEETKYIKEQTSSLESTAKQYKVSLEYLISYYYGISTQDELNEYLSLSYRRNLAAKEYVKSTIKDSEIEKYYKENIFGDISAKHILISVESLDGMTTEEQKAAQEKALKTAKEVITKLNNGERWDDLVKKYSKDDATKNKNGNLGWFSTGDMEATFEEAAFALKKGEYTKTPVKTKYGYHIIYKTDEKAKPTLKDSKDSIIEKLVTQKMSDDSTLYYTALEQIRKDSGLKIYDDELSKQYKEYMEQVKTKTNSNSN